MNASVGAVTPSRLVVRRGQWALELTRFVALDDKVLEPRAQRLEGRDAILRHLRHSSAKTGFYHGAAQLMRSLRGDEERAFVAVDGEWVPSRGEDSTRSELALRAELQELRAEFLLLRASHQRLRERVAELEAWLEELEPRAAMRYGCVPALPPVEAAARRSVEPVRAAAAPLAEAHANAATPPDQTQQSPGIVPEPPPPPLNPFQNAALTLKTGSDEARPENALVLPPAPQVLATLAELFGGDANLTPTDEPVPDSALELAALYAGRFVNDDGKDLGVLLGELRLIAHIGGKLMGLPTTVVDEQARTGMLSDQVLLAVSEVANTLSNTLNAVPGNAHVRSTPVEPFPADRLHWVGSARQCVALTRNRVGTLWLVSY